MFGKEDAGDEVRYVFEPPKWILIMAVILGFFMGVFYGRTLIGWMAIGLIYYIKMSVMVAQATIASFILLCLGIIILILMRSKFEIGFKTILLFLIALMIGLAAATVAQFAGYGAYVKAPFPIPEPPNDNDDAGDSDNIDINDTAEEGDDNETHIYQMAIDLPGWISFSYPLSVDNYIRVTPNIYI